LVEKPLVNALAQIAWRPARIPAVSRWPFALRVAAREASEHVRRDLFLLFGLGQSNVEIGQRRNTSCSVVPRTSAIKGSSGWFSFRSISFKPA